MSANIYFQGVQKKVRLNTKISEILEQLKIKSNLKELNFKKNNFELEIQMKTQTLQQLKVEDGNTIFISIKSDQDKQSLQQESRNLLQIKQPQYQETITDVALNSQLDSFEDLEQIQQQKNQQYALAQSKQNNLVDKIHQYSYGKYNVQVEDFCKKVTIYSNNQNFQVSFTQNKVFQTKNAFNLDQESLINVKQNINQNLIIYFFENQSGIYIKWVNENYTAAYIII